ncbi:TPA: hypothetical protein ACPSKY_000197 [Legionella bozemanae]
MAELISYWNYEELFNTVTKGSLILPLYYLNDDKFIDEFISELIHDFESIESISYSSFLNMVSQTQEVERIIQITNKELRYLNISPIVAKQGILFHRTNLLYVTTLLIKKIKGSKSITGNNKEGTKKYLKALSLINNKLGFRSGNTDRFILSYLIRDHPFCYYPEITQNFYIRWMSRYWNIYKEIKNESNKISEAIECLEKKINLSVENYFFVIAKLFAWFMYLPMHSQNVNKNGFSFENPNTFYIDDRKFPNDTKFISLIKIMSHDIEDMRSFFLSKAFEDEKMSRNFDSTYQDLMKFFNKPLFKIDNHHYCILDFKFLIEGICSGFIWQLHEMKIANLPELRAQYGFFLEKYFRNLLSKYFKLEHKNDQYGPDAVVISGNNILLFEFTVEYYRIGSLYSSAMDDFFSDLEKILFNPKKNGIRGKKDPGKFIKLDGYVRKYLSTSQEINIIPILVTEKYLGDYHLLNWDGLLTKKITSLKLDNLIKEPPLILCLDDLELFWSFICSEDKTKAANEFISCINSWKNCPKQDFLYNFSFFLSTYFKDIEKLNAEYTNFFSFPKFLQKVKAHNEEAAGTTLEERTNEIPEEGIRVTEAEVNMKGCTDKLVSKIKENPLTSILFAGGIGYLLAKILKK